MHLETGITVASLGVPPQRSSPADARVPLRRGAPPRTPARVRGPHLPRIRSPNCRDGVDLDLEKNEKDSTRIHVVELCIVPRRNLLPSSPDSSRSFIDPLTLFHLANTLSHENGEDIPLLVVSVWGCGELH